jgi:hypothetical protein
MGTSEARMAQGPTDRPSPIVTTRARSGWHEDGTAVAMPEGSTGRCLATRLSHRKWSGRGQKVVIPCHSPVDAARAFPRGLYSYEDTTNPRRVGPACAGWGPVLQTLVARCSQRLR